MKALIWIGCIFTLSALLVIIKNAGILLGGIPSAVLFGITWWTAKSLTKKVDSKRENKNKEQQETEECAIIEHEDNNEKEKQKQIDANTVKGKKIKIGALLSSHIKIIFILTAISVVLFAASYVGGYVCDTNCTKARNHYNESYVLKDDSFAAYIDDSFAAHTIGCGLETCSYCHGTKEYHYGKDIKWSEYSNFPYYNSTLDTYYFFESCLNVFLILTLVFVFVLLISALCRYKFIIVIRKRQ